LGRFLWSGHHAKPTWRDGQGAFRIAQGTFSRKVARIEGGWQVEDTFEPYRPFLVRWQFAPGVQISAISQNSWRLQRQDASFDIQVNGAAGEIGRAVVSPGFRQTAQAPFLELKTESEACVLRTKFLDC
jgi:hypothetical protein